MSDEFYIGYEPDMPPGLASRIRRAACVVIACALLAPGTLVLTQGRFAEAVFEFGKTRTFEGTLIEYPYPALMADSGDGSVTMYWLVGEGKHGAATLAKNRDGQRVRLSGTLIRRGQDAMIEVAAGAIVAAGPGSARMPEPLRSLGSVEMQGEIVDSKCHLGVMKPGEGPTHRDCAVRCLLGRIPPMFVPHDAGSTARVALVSENGGTFADASSWAGRAVSIRGEMFQRGTQRFLAASPSGIRMID